MMSKREERKLKKMFRTADSRIMIDPKQRRRTAVLLQRMAVGENVAVVESMEAGDRVTVIESAAGGWDSERRLIDTKSTWQILKSQLHYMEKKFWAADILANLVFVSFFFILRFYGAGTADIRMYSSLAASILGSVSILVLSNVFGNGMAELTETCFFNMKQLAALQMTVLGFVNLAGLTFAAVYAGIQWRIPLIWMGLYVGCPFLFTAAVSLSCLMKEKLRNQAFCVLAAGMISAVLFSVLASLSGLPAGERRAESAGAFLHRNEWISESVLISGKELLRESGLALWIVIFAGGAVLLAVQTARLFGKIGKGEILCTDWN